MYIYIYSQIHTYLFHVLEPSAALSLPLCQPCKIPTLHIVCCVFLAAKAQGWFSGVYAWYKQLAQVVEFVS